MRSLAVLAAHETRELVCPWCGRRPDRGSEAVVALRDGRVIGALVLAPADRDRDLCPPDSFVIERLWVNPDDVGENIATQLVQRACADLLLRRARCLVAYGTRGRPTCSRPPADWLLHAGFAEYVGGVQWRLELRRTLPIFPALKDAAALAVRLLRPERPQPANRVRHT